MNELEIMKEQTFPFEEIKTITNNLSVFCEREKLGQEELRKLLLERLAIMTGYPKSKGFKPTKLMNKYQIAHTKAMHRKQGGSE